MGEESWMRLMRQNSGTSSRKNASATEQDPKCTKWVEQSAESPMRGIQFHDPGEQRWIGMGKQELERRGHILAIRRSGYTLPNGTNTPIYHERREGNQRVGQVAIKRFDDEPANAASKCRGGVALRELGLPIAEEEY